MDNLPQTCYALSMNRLQEWKADGFRGEQMIVLPTESFQAYMEHPQVKRMYLTDIGFFPCAKHHFRERREGIEEYIFIYCTEGKGTILVEGQEYTLRENQAFCIPRLKKHLYYACREDPWSILWVHFNGEDTCLFPLDQQKPVTFSSENAANRIHFLFDLLFRVLDGSYTLGNFIYISQVLSLILGETYHREKENTTLEQNKQVTNVIRYMSRHLEENLKLEDIAEEFELSKSYLNAIFQKYTQHPPMDFFLNLKMKRACRLLRATDSYVYEVARQLGYSDQYYFSRIFKKVVGMSPKEYKHSDNPPFRSTDGC